MKRKTYILLFCCLAFSLLIVITLVMNYFRNQPKAGGFTRLLKSQAVTLKDSLKIGSSYYLAGLTSENIYLGTSKKTYLLKSSYGLKDTISIKLSLPKNWSRLTIRVDSPYVYAMDGTIPGILYSRLSFLDMKEVKFNPSYFSQSILLSPRSAVFKAYNGQYEVLIKKIEDAPNYYPKGILEPQNNEGLFSLHGRFHFEPKTSRLLYIYSYRNQFISLDTSLNILYKGNTIDTISTVKINVIKTKSSMDSIDSYTTSKPPLLVNKNCAITTDLIFVHSGLKADNEDRKSFKQSSVIDVYTLNSGQYQFSFYLPNFHTEKLSDFRVYKNVLVAVFANHICTYELHLGLKNEK